eukprot:364542-Chlamydomonas_euryale.AAC.19
MRMRGFFDVEVAISKTQTPARPTITIAVVGCGAVHTRLGIKGARAHFDNGRHLPRDQLAAVPGDRKRRHQRDGRQSKAQPAVAADAAGPQHAAQPTQAA